MIAERSYRSQIIGMVKPAGRARREKMPGHCISEQMMHAGDRIAHRHGAEGIAMVAPSQGQKPAFPSLSLRLPILNRHFQSDLDADRAGVA